MPTSPKQYLTIDEQVELLGSRGLELDGEAQRWLRVVNYYRLSGYWYIYRQLVMTDEGRLGRSDQFDVGTRFSTIAGLYEFDRKLRTLVHDGVERVEVALRSQVSYILGARGPLSYTSPSTFRDGFDHESWNSKARTRVQRAARRSPFIKHHIDHYGGVIPIWVLVDVLDFSDVSMLFEGLRATDQFAVAEGLGIDLNLDRVTPNQRTKALKNHPLTRWLEQLTVVRNIAAHHGRLWNRTVVPASTGAMRTVAGLQCLPPGQSEDIFGALTVIAKILETSSPGSSWVEKTGALVEQAIGELPGRSVRELGFPDDWRTLEIWNT
ncbi:Abi family protein [Frondihabitans sp. VKM Ac-2883]|uniref:Abi family protein n=1 Tax=Frondihabitans sp. VKM Ac-2883 TaxID=2783823 RepID=UPI00351C3887